MLRVLTKEWRTCSSSSEKAKNWLEREIPDGDADDNNDEFMTETVAATSAITTLEEEFMTAIGAAAFAITTLEEFVTAIAAATFAITTLEESNAAVAAATFAITALEEAHSLLNGKRTFPQAAEDSLIKTESRKEDSQPNRPSTLPHAPEVHLTKAKRQGEDNQLNELMILPQPEEASLTIVKTKEEHNQLPGLTASPRTLEISLTKAKSKKQDNPLAGPRTLPQAPEASLTQTKGRNAASPVTGLPKAGNISGRSSNKDEKKDKQFSGEDASARQAKSGNQPPSENATTNQKTPEKPMIPPIRKTPASTEEHWSGVGSTESERAKDMVPRPNPSSSIKPANPTAGRRKQKGGLIKNCDVETEANAWEKARMARIEMRYEKQKSTILSWESEKQMKAQGQLKKTEMKLGRSRARAAQKYHREMDGIDKIAGRTRALAEERRRNDESKMRAKANKIRSMGKVPMTCFCFV